MKAFVVFTALLAAACAVPTPLKLDDDLKEFFTLIKFDKIVADTRTELATNGQLIEVVKYLQTNFPSEITKIRADADFTPLKTLFTSKNVNIDQVGDTVIENLKNAKLGTSDGKATLKSWLDAVEKQVPIGSIIGFIARKELLSADFRDLMKELRSKTTHELADHIVTSPELKGLEKIFTADGVDLQPIIVAIYELLGWGKPPATL